MYDKEIEQSLKDGVEKIELKDFSERWESVSERIQISNANPCKLVDETVLVTAANGNATHGKLRKNSLLIICSVFLFLVLVLSIILPIVLRKNERPAYFDLNALQNIDVTENEFYSEIENLDLVDFSKFEFETYALLYTYDNDLAGGRLELIDEVEGIYSEIVFYTEFVRSYFSVGQDYKVFTVNGSVVQYKTVLSDDFYKTKAKTVKNKLSYEIECSSLDENVESFFEKVFG